MDALPEELLLNILHRLPVKSIGRCLCVKKYWRSLVKTPSFVSSESKICNKNDQYLFLWGGKNLLELRRLDDDNFGFYKLSNLHVEAVDFIFDNEYTVCGISVCNGLICFFTYPDILMLWNPTIHRLLTLPQPTLVVADEHDCRNTFTLWFDSFTDDYTVIRLIYIEYAFLMEPPQVEIFSLNNNSWKVMSLIAPPFEINGPSIPILNGALHWVGFCNDYIKNNSILGFDVNAEVFWKIDFPNILKALYVRSFNLAVYKETSIAICCHESCDDAMDVWVMQEYYNVESWTKIWRNDTSHQTLLCALHVGHSRHVIGLLNNRQVLWELFVWVREPDGHYKAIIATDPESGIMKNSAVVPGTYYIEDVRYFEESLVLLDNASALSTTVVVLST